MKRNLQYQKEQLVYPGSYVPLLEEPELKAVIKQSFDCESAFPQANIQDISDSYVVEITIPGINREDFLIHADNNVLSVCVLHKDNSLHAKEQTMQHGFNFGVSDHHLNLPANADAAFISAEYKAGTLRLYIPKSARPVKNLHNRIVVY